MATPVPAGAQPPARTLYRRIKFAAYELLRVVVWGLAYVLIGFRVRGARNVPKAGPLIVVSNHLHNFDMIVLSAAVPRPIYYMAKRELFAKPFPNWFIRNFGGFPVNRGAIDRAALRHVGLLLAEGLVVGILPEGTRSTTRALQEGNPGVALIAMQQGVPLLPVGITGTQDLPFDAKGTGARWFGRARARVTIGKPFTLPPRRPGEKPDLAAATERIMLEIAALLPPEYRGVYADRLAAAQARGEYLDRA